MVEIQTLTANPERVWSDGNLYSLLAGVQNGTATLKDSLVFFFLNKTKHTLTILSHSYASWYSPKGAENICPYKTLHTDVYSSFIHNCQDWKQPRCPSVLGK